jgi:hypothetical protein
VQLSIQVKRGWQTLKTHISRYLAVRCIASVGLFLNSLVLESKGHQFRIHIFVQLPQLSVHNTENPAVLVIVCFAVGRNIVTLCFDCNIFSISNNLFAVTRNGGTNVVLTALYNSLSTAAFPTNELLHWRFPSNSTAYRRPLHRETVGRCLFQFRENGLNQFSIFRCAH